MKLVNVSVDYMRMLVIINNVRIEINADVRVKELINKGMCDKDFIWNSSNCNCEYDELFDIGE